MEVVVGHPISYCEGVTKAFILAKSVGKKHAVCPIYLVGSLVHNEIAVQELTSDNFIILDERNGDLIEQMSRIPDGSIVIYSAHGHPREMYDSLAKKKKFIVYDSTCSYVDENENKIRKYSFLGKDILYFGLKNHLEAKSITSIPNVYILDAQNYKDFDFDKLNDKSPILICQTTMEENETNEMLDFVKGKIPNVQFIGGRCQSTIDRQRNIAFAPKECDLFVILGSSTSNNTMKLVQIAKEAHPKAQVIRVLNLEELKKQNIKKGQICFLATGASTSPQTFNECREYLINF